MTELALIFGIAALGLVFAGYLARWVLAQPAGDGDMLRYGALIRGVAETFHRKQSSTIAAVSAVLGGAIFLAYGLLRRAGEIDPVPALELDLWLTISFALGVACSVASGHVAQWISTRTSARAAAAVRRSVDLALQIAIRGGAVSGLFLTATSLLGMAGLFAAVLATSGGFGSEPAAALSSRPPSLDDRRLRARRLVRVAPCHARGGTFAKAADLGADLAGQEVGVGEDDPENPATIVDLAGDHVGDCAARATGLFESTVAENLGAMLAGSMLYRQNHAIHSALSVMLFPLVTRAFGLVAGMFGVMVVRTDDREVPLAAFARGLYVTAVLHAVGVAGAAKWLLGAHWIRFLGCAGVGIASGIAFFHAVQYYTDAARRPTRSSPKPRAPAPRSPCSTAWPRGSRAR